ncbi:MAG: hypothetical protein G01um101418_430 [Parcubacteria group bacterium Gr01-1014_18]|nr:MAG: hypothetical protein Greene041636_475 [Parcubacteria group bacterium Greene0416_36]TSC81017.1 MAG: hypothetical protein G01um101418_430 [Parcubacteria group bacterium Gr01-1014_18]TSC98939.1 MAG: hypothetical protein Greene101420_451 [Parcubacteria group bacterium Greene1014_20]TSD06769.1 MAG: hypothetical protein Greene07142_690 [Parcubacteria group bacterium Greene0714_2]
MITREQWHGIAFVILLLAGIIVIRFKLAANIEGPIDQIIAANEKNKNNALFGTQVETLLSESELRARDTDKDGLNDYEESYIYKTSIYLPDTDSDGAGDKEEVSAGQDPRCAKGEDCKLVNLEVLQQEKSLSIMDALSPEAQVAGVDLSSIPPEQFELILKGQASAEQIRGFLILNGLEESVVDSMDEEAVNLLYRSVLDKINKGK